MELINTGLFKYLRFDNGDTYELDDYQYYAMSNGASVEEARAIVDKNRAEGMAFLEKCMAEAQS